MSQPFTKLTRCPATLETLCVAFQLIKTGNFILHTCAECANVAAQLRTPRVRSQERRAGFGRRNPKQGVLAAVDWKIPAIGALLLLMWRKQHVFYISLVDACSTLTRKKCDYKVFRALVVLQCR